MSTGTELSALNRASTPEPNPNLNPVLTLGYQYMCWVENPGLLVALSE